MLDYGIFYEFVPVEDLGTDGAAAAHGGRGRAGPSLRGGDEHARPGSGRTRSATRSGSPARDPLRLVITGRTRHYVNAFGENVIVEEVERALVARLPPDRGGGGGVHGGAALAEPGRAAGRARVAGGVPRSPDASRMTSHGSWTRRSRRSTPTTAPSAAARRDGCTHRDRAAGRNVPPLDAEGGAASAISTRWRGSPTIGRSRTRCSSRAGSPRARRLRGDTRP